MYDLIEQMGHLANRLSGPLYPMVIVQPFASGLLAILDGVHDAETRRPPFFWSLMTPAGRRRDMLADGWKSIGKILLIALTLDAAYQWVELRYFDVGEALLVACGLAIVPYLLVRGPVTRLLGKRRLSA